MQRKYNKKQYVRIDNFQTIYQPSTMSTLDKNQLYAKPAKIARGYILFVIGENEKNYKIKIYHTLYCKRCG